MDGALTFLCVFACWPLEESSGFRSPPALIYEFPHKNFTHTSELFAMYTFFDVCHKKWMVDSLHQSP